MDSLIEVVRTEVQSIKKVQNDPELASSKEGNLYIAVLMAIARDKKSPWAKVAYEALKTQKIKFERWTA